MEKTKEKPLSLSARKPRERTKSLQGKESILKQVMEDKDVLRFYEAKLPANAIKIAVEKTLSIQETLFKKAFAEKIRLLKERISDNHSKGTNAYKEEAKIIDEVFKDE